MGNAVNHFEIHGKDAAKTGKFYGDLFGWKISTHEASGYSIVDTGAGEGIGGGIMQNPEQRPMVTVYVSVDDIDEGLAKAEKLGASIVMPKQQIPDGPAIGLFSDPDGNVVGLAKF